MSPTTGQILESFQNFPLFVYYSLIPEKHDLKKTENVYLSHLAKSNRECLDQMDGYTLDLALKQVFGTIATCQVKFYNRRFNSEFKNWISKHGYPFSLSLKFGITDYMTIIGISSVQIFQIYHHTHEIRIVEMNYDDLLVVISQFDNSESRPSVNSEDSKIMAMDMTLIDDESVKSFLRRSSTLQSREYTRMEWLEIRKIETISWLDFRELLENRFKSILLLISDQNYIQHFNYYGLNPYKTYEKDEISMAQERVYQFIFHNFFSSLYGLTNGD